MDRSLNWADPNAFDALRISGGLQNPDALRLTPSAVELVKHFSNEGKPITAICHAPWVLIEAVLKRQITQNVASKEEMGGDASV